MELKNVIMNSYSIICHIYLNWSRESVKHFTPCCIPAVFCSFDALNTLCLKGVEVLLYEIIILEYHPKLDRDYWLYWLVIILILFKVTVYSFKLTQTVNNHKNMINVSRDVGKCSHYVGIMLPLTIIKM